MSLLHGVLFEAGIFFAGVLWCYYIIRRLPNDIFELRKLYRKYRTRNAPHIIGGMKEDHRLRYQSDCNTEFWAAFTIQVLLLWPVTSLVLFFVIIFMIFKIVLPAIQVFI